MTRFVYFMQAVEGGLIKIGSANDVQGRLKTLQAGCPIPLRLLGSAEGTITGEFSLHKSLSAHRMHGEWFAPHAEVIAAMNDAIGGKINLTIKPAQPERMTRSIQMDSEIIGVIGRRKLARAFGFQTKEITSWVHAGIPASHRKQVHELYYKAETDGR